MSVFKERLLVPSAPHSAQFISGKVRASGYGVRALHLGGFVPGGIRLECIRASLCLLF